MEQLILRPAVDQRRFGLGCKERDAGARRSALHRSRSLERHGVEHHPAARNRTDREDVVARAERPGRNFDLGAKAFRRGFARIEIVLIGSCGSLNLRAEIVECDLEPRSRTAVDLNEVELQPQCGLGIGLADPETDQQPALRIARPAVGGTRNDERDVRCRTVPDSIERRAPGETFRNVGIASVVERKLGRRTVGLADLPQPHRIRAGPEARPYQCQQYGQQHKSAVCHMLYVFICVNILPFYSASSHVMSVIAATCEPVSSVISVPTLSVSGQ